MTMKQENCPVCGRLMETFETDSGRQVQICDRSSDTVRPHVAQVVFLASPMVLKTGRDRASITA